MGMFDNIKCQYPLPVEKLAQYPELASSFDAQKEIYQTKDLENWMLYYTIKEDGTIWLNEEKEQQFITSTIHFYTIKNIEDGPNDYMIEFCGKWSDGILQSLECWRIDPIPNNIRKDTRKKLQEISKRNEKFFFKRIYLPYSRIIRKIFCRLSKIFCLIERALYKIERFLTPF